MEEAASLIREVTEGQCTTDPVKNSWPQKLTELQQVPVLDSVKLCFQCLLGTEKQDAQNIEKK